MGGMDKDFPILVWKNDIIVNLVVEGDPAATARARHGKNGWYTPAKSADYRDLLAYKIREQAGMLDSRDTFGVQAFFFRSNRQRIDVDNLLKTVLDAGTKANLWHDDSQVRELVGRVWLADDNPRLECIFYHLTNPTSKGRCKQCGKDFEGLKDSHDGRIYCSKKCKDADKRTELICGNCGESFAISQCLTKTGASKRRYCSKACTVQAYRKLKRIKGKESEKWVCEVCGGRVSRKEYKRCRACGIEAHTSENTQLFWKLRHKA